MGCESGALSEEERAIRSAAEWALRDETHALAAVEEKMFGPPPFEPFRLARYIVLGKLGAGGVGVVFLGHDPELDRAVAIKILKSTDREGLTSLQARERFVREARAVAKFTHANVIAIHDVGTFDLSEVGHHIDPRMDEERSGQGVFIVMELVEGKTLDAWCREGPHEPAEVLKVFLAAGAGLAAAHDAGIIHRDFKPANVLLRTEDGRQSTEVKVADFGLAVSVDEPQPSSPRLNRATPTSAPSTRQTNGGRLTETGLVLGTPAFMAPEQHRGEDAQAWSDQYSFCAAMYVGLFGRLPFEGSNWTELYEAKMRAPLRFPDARVPSWLRRVLERGLSPDASDRFPTMVALLETLGRDRNRKWRIWGGAAAVVIGVGGLASAASVALQPGVLELEVTAGGGPVPSYSLRIDAERRELDDDGRLELSAGRHVIEVEAADHERAVELVELTRGETRRLSIDLDHDTGLLDLEVQPRGGIVLIDGVDRGARLADYAIDTGTHQVVVRHRGYFDRRFELEVAADQHIEKYVALQEAVAWSQPRSGATGAFGFVGDADGDGFEDVMHVFFNKLSIYDPWADEELMMMPLGPSATVLRGNLDEDEATEIVIVRGSVDGLGVEVRQPDDGLKLSWSRDLAGPSTAAPFIGDVSLADLDGDGALDVLAAVSEPARLVGLRGTDGSSMYEYPLDDNPLAVVALDGPQGRRAYVLGEGSLAAFDLERGSRTWSVETMPAPKFEAGEAAQWVRTIGPPGRRGSLLHPIPRDDGPPDLAVVSVLSSSLGRVNIREAGAGNTRWSATASRVPLTARPSLDFDHDGVADVLLQPTAGELAELRSGASGRVLSTTPGPRTLVELNERVVLVSWGGGEVELVEWHEGATRTVARRTLDVSTVHLAMDWNADGRQELLVSTQDNSLMMLDDELVTVGSVLLPRGALGIAEPVDADRDGVLDLVLEAHGPVVLRGPKLRWARPFTDAVRGAPVPYDVDGDGRLDLALSGEVDGRPGFYVMTAATGEFVVGTDERLGDASIRGAVAIARDDGGNDFLIPHERALVRVRGENGDIVAKARLPLSYAKPAVADVDGDGRLEAFTVDWEGDGHIYVIDVDTMTIERTLPLPGGGWGEPAIADVTGDGVLDVAATQHDGTVRVYDTRTWSEHWATPTEGRLAFGPTVVTRADGSKDLVVGPANEARAVVYLDGRTGEVVWRREQASSGRSRPLAHDVDGDGEPEIFSASVDGRVFRLTVDGELVWTAEVTAVDQSRPGPSGPISLYDLQGDDTMELLSGWEDGTLRVHDADDGALAWVFHTGGQIEAPPLALDVDGDGDLEVVISSHDRTVYCLD